MAYQMGNLEARGARRLVGRRPRKGTFDKREDSAFYVEEVGKMRPWGSNQPRDPALPPLAQNHLGTLANSISPQPSNPTRNPRPRWYTVWLTS